jgi:hypothetical protein
MTAPVADLETGSVESTTPEVSTTESHSLSSLLDDALDSEQSIAAEGSETPEETKARIDRGDGRDATGKFVGKEPIPPKAGETPPVTTPEAATTAPPKAPFRYRALGKTNDVDGSEIDDTGRISFAPEQHSRLAQAFNALEVLNGQVGPVIEKHKQENARLAQELETARTERSAKDTQAGALVDALTAAFNEPDEAKSLEALWAMRQNFPLLLANAEREHWKTQAERAKTPAPAPKVEAPPPQNTSASLFEEARVSALDELEEWKIHPNMRGVSSEIWKQVEDLVTQKPLSFTRPATADDAKQYAGIQVGQMVFDRDLLLAEVDSRRTQADAARETATKQTELARKNAVRTQTTIAAPPVAGGTQPPPKGGTQRFKTKEEYEAWKASDEIDDD